MGKTLSRRRVVAWGAAGAAGAALPVVGSPAAGADELSGAPGRFFDVTKFGAKGDGRTIDTAAINRAIDAAAVRGGTVYFPAGTYASYSIHLRSNIALYLGANATILAAAPAGGRGYDPAEPGAGNPYQDFGHSHAESAPLNGNKAIALKLCRNVAIRDITIVNGGHFGVLPTGVDNFRIDGLVIDTNRDGIDIDCCKNVRIANTTVNSPNDDAIVLKSTYALNQVRDTENVTIDNCFVSGYDLGTLVAGTDKTAAYGRTGRVKFGTESTGGFRTIAISNVVFEHCRGLALETVDGGWLEDVTISNLTMRNVQMPLFLRLGARMRGPVGVPVGFLRRVSINGVTTIDADPRYPSCLAGIPGHPIEDVKLSNIRHHLAGGLSPGDAVADPPELETAYPEPSMFGTLPAYGFFVRHARGISWDNVDVRFGRPDTRPACVLRDVTDADVHHGRADQVAGTPTFVLDGVDDFRVSDGRPVPEARVDHADHREL